MNEIDLILNKKTDLIKISKNINSIRQFKIHAKKIIKRNFNRKKNFTDLALLMYFACLRNPRCIKSIQEETYILIDEYAKEEIKKVLDKLK